MTTQKARFETVPRGDSPPPQPQQQREDNDAIDYSTALKREFQRSQAGNMLWQKNPGFEADFNHKVHTGFVPGTFVTDSSENKEVVFDVLPSFQLHCSLQNPPIDSTDSRNPEFPPEYSPHNNTGESYSYRQPTSRSLSFQSNSTDPSYSLSSDSNSGSYTDWSLNFRDEELFPEEDLFDKNLIDNLHRLPQRITGETEVKVHVTKDVPSPNQPWEAESMLKEYTSGDVVHGYVTVRNKTKKPIQFHAFYITLEGTISIIDVKRKKQMLKKFVNMVDVSASWSPACISPSGNTSYIFLNKDTDGSVLGLPRERVLAPETTYKKYFTFKLPYNTLDTTCRHQQELHTLLPPSFGVNVLKKKGKYSHMEINPILHFGHTGEIGSPILTKDLSNRHLSIGYSINGTLCALKSIGAPAQKKLCVINEGEYALRFIPFGFGVSLFSSQKSIRQLKRLVEHSFISAERALKLLKQGQEEEVRQLDCRMKLEQLRINSIGDPADSSLTNFPLRNQVQAPSDFSKIQTDMAYIQDQSLLSKLKPNSTSNSNGFLSITTQLPKDGLPYISPSLLRKTNEASKLTSLGYENLKGMKSQLSTNEKKKLEDLEINLRFQPSDGFSKSSSFPTISSIEIKLLVLNIFSSGSIPIKLSADVCQPHLFNDLTKDFVEYHERLEDLKSQFEEIDSNINKYISPDIISDIEAMKNLKNESFLLRVFNHKISKQSAWTKLEDGSYSQDLALNLEFKPNIEETLIPNFQTCILSRTYFIQVDFRFKNGKMTSLKVPIRLRQFDGLS